VGYLWPEAWAKNTWSDIWRAMFDLATPFADGTQRTNYPEGRIPLFGGLYIPLYFYLMFVTINIALLSTLAGFAAAFGLCFLAASNATANRAVRFGVRRLLEFQRAFPEIVIAFLWASILSLGPIPAIIAIATHTTGALGKLFYEVVENADAKPCEGLAAVGASWLQRIRFGLVPLVLPNFLSYALLRFEINIRESTIIGAVGGGGIGDELRLAISRGYGPKATAMMILLFVTVITIDRVSAVLRRRLVGATFFAPAG
jgi:phosphonate transport system permease protein